MKSVLMMISVLVYRIILFTIIKDKIVNLCNSFRT